MSLGKTHTHRPTHKHTHTCDRHLLLQAPGAAVKLEKECGQDRVGQRVEAVTGTDHHIVQELCNMTLCLFKLTNTITEQNSTHVLRKCWMSRCRCVDLLYPRTVHSPMRAMGTPACSTCTVLSTAAWTEGKEQTADTMPSGIPYSRSVALVRIPNVPSEPTNRFVKL